MWGDPDSHGIVFYHRYYEWIDASGHLFFEAIGLNLGDLRNERQIHFTPVETSCSYHKPGRYHQKISIATHVDALADKTVVLKHAIRERPTGALLVEGYEKRICLDVSDSNNFRATDIPDNVLSVLKDAMNE